MVGVTLFSVKVLPVLLSDVRALLLLQLVPLSLYLQK